jgi:hypothetical protein
MQCLHLLSNHVRSEYLHRERHRIGAMRAAGSDAFFLPDGSWYVGRFHPKLGYGRRYFPDGRIYEGAWFQGMLHRRGRAVNKTGVTFEGQWDRGSRNGVGVEWKPDGTMLRCGLWVANEFFAFCPVPRCYLMPDCRFLTPSMRAAGDDVVLTSGGGYYALVCDHSENCFGNSHVVRIVYDEADEATGCWLDGRLCRRKRGMNVEAGHTLISSHFRARWRRSPSRCRISNARRNVSRVIRGKWRRRGGRARPTQCCGSCRQPRHREGDEPSDQCREPLHYEPRHCGSMLAGREHTAKTRSANHRAGA